MGVKFLFALNIIFRVMIRYIKGNLLEDDAQALVNTVNTVGVMGKGIALQFREAFPQNYKLYSKACKAGEVKVGQMFITVEFTVLGNRFIINFPTKQHWRNPSEYSFIESGLIALRQEIINRDIKSIAIPPLGTNNGGLSWSIVREMIESKLGDLDCDIRLYEPNAAIAEKMKQERVKLTPARAMLLDVMCDLRDYDEFDSVFAAEKIVYFLQRFGARDQFKILFQRYYYGPYSGGTIAHVLYALNGSYIKGMTGMQLKPFDVIWMGDDTHEIVTAFLNKPEYSRYKKIAEDTKLFLRGYYSNYSLELLSSVDYILCNSEHFKEWKSMPESIIIKKLNEELSHWNSHKRSLFANNLYYLTNIFRHLSDYSFLYN